MEKIGLQFKIPNEYGKFISQILNELDVEDYDWYADNDEIHKVKDGKLSDDWLFNHNEISGKELKKLINDNIYYSIFVDLKGFRSGKKVIRVDNYRHFIDSDCEIALLIVDCTDVYLYAKDKEVLDKVFQNAMLYGYKNIKYIKGSKSKPTDMLAF